ncbi:MAG: arginine--tRNA ligase [Methylacidiphilales bacterium]|nr:arginine--tRNA ligase [Candidatus Methylacidiphilales bacterium]
MISIIELRESVANAVAQAINTLQLAGYKADLVAILKTITINDSYERGDISSSIALQLYGKYALKVYKSPLDFAHAIVTAMPESEVYTSKVVNPGYINIDIALAIKTDCVNEINTLKNNYGYLAKKNKKILLEYVSANPTGPLHVGRARGAIVGMALARILKVAGWDVDQEYYVNDNGRQLDVLALSVILSSKNIPLLQGCYTNLDLLQTTKNIEIASLVSRFTIDMLPNSSAAQDELIDSAITKCKAQCSRKEWRKLIDWIVENNLACIRNELATFDIQMDSYVYESALATNQELGDYFHQLNNPMIYKDEEGTTWFKATQYGEESDRVLIRASGVPTYFAYDLYYHILKLNRGYEGLINIWGADHHGYVPRLTNALQALTNSKIPLEILLVQFVTLKNSLGVISSMSTREGTAININQLVSSIGAGVVKIYYLQRSTSQHIEFDLQSALEQNNNNPYYYLQYAHARCVSLLHEAKVRYPNIATDYKLNPLDLLHVTSNCEIQLLQTLIRYPFVVHESASTYSPHKPLIYLRDLATQFHLFYHEITILVDEEKIRTIRLTLIHAIKQVLHNGLSLYAIQTMDKLDRDEK